MEWLEITLQTGRMGAEEAAAALTAAGFTELVVEDQAELESFLDQNRDRWDYIDEDLQKSLAGLSRVRLYLTPEDREGLDRLRAWAGEQALPMSVVSLGDVDWEEKGRESYPPQPVGRRLMVLPYWRAAECPPDRLPVILDPGLTFGTGAHPSTQMVLEAMEELVRPGDVCLDLGSGSGILSLGAVRLGAGETLGIDVDPKAEDAARQNAAYNGFTACSFATGDLTRDPDLMARLAERSYDLVFVNIVAEVILRLAPALPRLLGAQGTAICSGILDTRLEEVLAALEGAGLAVTQVREKEEWRCVCAKRRTE